MLSLRAQMLQLHIWLSMEIQRWYFLCKMAITHSWYKPLLFHMNVYYVGWYKTPDVFSTPIVINYNMVKT